MILVKITSVYEFTDYKKFVRAWLSNQPLKGRGFFTILAERLGTSNAAISQIFKDDRHLSPENAVELCELLSLGDDETYYFLQLVDYARAGSIKLQKKLLAKIKNQQLHQQKLINLLPKDTQLNETARSIFYSSWVYSGVRNLIATNQAQNLDELSRRMKLDKTKIQGVIQFLLDYQLLVKVGDKLTIGPQKTHLENTSPWVTKHHQNWRIKAIEVMQNGHESDLFYSAPMSLSKEVAEKVRQQLPEFIKQIIEEVGPSKSEIVRCLNIDWFEY